jgi:membrane protease YdiL (CAAX protease family)
LSETQREALEAVRATVRERIDEDPQAAFLHALVKTELGKPVRAEDLAALRRSVDPEHLALAELYGAATLDPAGAERIAARIRGDGFPDRLARMHAHEKAGDAAARGRLIRSIEIAALIAISLGIVGAMALGLIAWAAYFVQRGVGAWRPLGHPLGDVAPHEADALAWRMALYLMAMAAIPILLSPALGLGVPGMLLMLVGKSLVLVFVIVMLRQAVLGSPGVLRRALGRTDRPLALIGWGVAGFFANMPVLALLLVGGQWLFRGLPPPSHPVSEEIAAGAGVFAILAIVFLAVVLAPLIEELMFRGVLQPAIGRFAGVAGGVLFSSLLFAAIHPQGPALVLSLAAVGAMAAALTHQTRSLVPAIVMHAVHNGAVLSLAILMT